MDTAFQLGGGATWLNFMATIGRAYGARPDERIPGPAELAAWLRVVDLSPRSAPTEEDVKDAHALRATLRELALAHADRREPAAEAVRKLQSWLPDAPPAFRPGTNGLRADPPHDTREALARIALQAAMHLAGPEREQLHACPEHDCRWVFADPTGRRRWCPSPACANRGRVRAHRARRARR